MRVQALGPELSIEAFNECVVGRLAGSGEVEDDAFLVCPQIQIPRDKFAALIDTNSLGIAQLLADPLERPDDIFRPIGKPDVHCWRKPRIGIDDRQDPDLPTGGQLIMHEVHRPSLVHLGKRCSGALADAA